MTYDPRLQGARYHAAVEETASTTEASAAFDCKKIMYITNDGAVDIVFNIDAATTAAGAFTLKPGETLSDWDRQTNTLYYKTASSTAAFRALGSRG